MIIDDIEYKSMNISIIDLKHRWKSLKIDENQWKSKKIDESKWKSMKIAENQWKSKLPSGGLFLPFTDRSKRPRTDLGADMSSKWSQNGVQNGSPEGPRQGMPCGTRFSSLFHWFLSFFKKDFSMPFYIAAACEWRTSTFRISPFLQWILKILLLPGSPTINKKSMKN